MPASVSDESWKPAGPARPLPGSLVTVCVSRPGPGTESMARLSDLDPVAWEVSGLWWPRPGLRGPGFSALSWVCGQGRVGGPRRRAQSWPLGGGWAAEQPAEAPWTVEPTPSQCKRTFESQAPGRCGRPIQLLVSLLGALGGRRPGPRAPPPLPPAVWVLASQSNSAPPVWPLQAAVERPRSLADPAAGRPSPQRRAWRPASGRPPCPRCTQRGTATAGRR